MKILITGNLGYIGSFLVPYLKKKNKKNLIIGYDSGYFKPYITDKKNDNLEPDIQIYKDIRDIHNKDLAGIDCIIHLCSLSNDPIGKRFEKITDKINYLSSKKLFQLAKKNKIKKFIFASSCSTYGFGGNLIKSENSKTKPLTAYARSKIKFEGFLKKNSTNKIQVTVLRFATACGYSPRLRLDLVLNDFVDSALKFKKIVIKSNGKPFRPLIDVEDMSKIIDWSINNNKKNFLILNAGSNKNNFSVKEMALKVRKNFNNKVKIVLNDKIPDDKRSYKVNFDLLNKNYKSFRPKTIDQSISDLKISIKKLVKLKYKSKNLIRLNVLNNLIKKRKINKNLVWNEE